MEFVENYKNKIQAKLQPVYSSTERLLNNGLSNKVYRGYLQELLQQVYENIQESLSEDILENLGLISKKEAILNIHFTSSPEMLENDLYREKFE